MTRYKTVFTTERGQRHQQAALDAAPDNLEITMLRQPSRETLLAHLADAVYLISERVGTMDAGLIQAAPKLKLIQRLGSLTYDIDLEAAQAAGVIVCYWPVGSVIRVAEHLMLQMLALSKKLRETEAIALATSPVWGESKRTTEDTFAYNWSNRQNVEGLWQRTVGILGLGEIGAELARRLRGWDCPLLYHKRRRLPETVEAELGLTYVTLEDLLTQSDFLVNLLPYFSNTDLMINAAYFERMKDGAYLVSCGSGSVINEADLAAAVKSGKLGGAALDTFEWEPLKPDNPLIALAKANDNVLLTPHIAAGGSAAAARERLGDYTNLTRHINGQPLQYVAGDGQG
ncbi:MAG TPA: NAD(P)-dependent oxidoreductase [Anaerolineae bacterium]|nr:NAD(P)-dependent oxidoreductase [Anaerolineae bacterium]